VAFNRFANPVFGKSEPDRGLPTQKAYILRWEEGPQKLFAARARNSVPGLMPSEM
jgi:hypothetical protein